MKRKMDWPKATRSPCARVTPSAPSPGGFAPLTKVIAAASLEDAESTHFPSVFTTTACSSWMPRPASPTSGASLVSPAAKLLPMQVRPSLKAKRSLFVSKSSSLRFVMCGKERSSFFAFSCFCVACWASSMRWAKLFCISLSASSRAAISACARAASSGSPAAVPGAPPWSTSSLSFWFSSRSCRMSLSCGFSLICAEFLMRFARSAYRRVESVSS
mmetsp:Transcript_30491/g.97454  ORF Transcript_30491/g.97454 Transcript_30491/m.97454 type:complete len:216 (-) Transcript_30491:82-729(-)